MKTGIVMKTDGHKAILLKSDGSFVSVKAKSGWTVGETVPVSSEKGLIVRFLAMAACLAVLALGGFGLNQLYLSPAALVSLDVNPSIELLVNRLDRVVSAKALNEEGSRILEEADIENKSSAEALTGILDAEGAVGYLSAGADVVLTVYARNSEKQSALLNELKDVVDSQASLYSDKIRTECHAVDESVVDGAHGHGVTAGKYLYLQRLKELAPETDLSGYSHHSIDEIKGEIRACHQRKDQDAKTEDTHRETETQTGEPRHEKDTRTDEPHYGGHRNKEH